MRLQVISLLPFLLPRVLATPASPLHDLFTSSEVPDLGALDLSLFNLSKTHHRDADSQSEKRALNLGYLLYSITMDGRTQNNWQPFLVQGSLLITSGIPSSATTNGANPYDCIIAIGSPAVSPVAGSIRYASNRYLYKFIGGSNSNSILDYAYVTANGNTISFVVDNRIAAANQLSQFNARSGLLANVYVIAAGGFTLNLNAAGLTGFINIVGQGYISPYQAPYKATISGTMVGRGTVTV